MNVDAIIRKQGKKTMTDRRACKNVSFSLLLFCLLYKKSGEKWSSALYIKIYNNIQQYKW